MTEESVEGVSVEASRFPGGTGLGELFWEVEARKYYGTVLAYREHVDAQVTATLLEADTAATVWFSAVVAAANSEIIGPLCREFFGEYFGGENKSMELMAAVVTGNTPKEEKEEEVNE